MRASFKGLRVVFIPGNAGGSTRRKWFAYLAERIRKQFGIPVIQRAFPDPALARRKVWIPFLEKECKVDKNTILVGHSSGAAAAMRYAETHQVYGTILISPAHTDLGIREEKLSGYFNEPWDWAAIRSNQNWVAAFASLDDPWIPIHEARHIAKHLKPDYFEFDKRGHFRGTRFPEVWRYLKDKLRAL